MAKLRTILTAIWATGACSAIPSLSPTAMAGEPSAWADSAHSAARLIPAGVARPNDDLPGGLLAGIEVRLDPTFITYWRSPGDAGAAPSFSFAGSSNLKDARVEYPAPLRFDEAGVEAFGYRDNVTFPIVVTANDPARPVGLDLAFDYAVCANICLPAKAHLTAVLDGSPSVQSTIVHDALADVPQVRKLGEAGPVGIAAVMPDSSGGYTVDATTPDGSGTLFAEAPEPWFLAASMGHPDGTGHVRFTLSLSGGPSGRAPREPVHLTLVSPAGAIEVPVRLDAPAPKP